MEKDQKIKTENLDNELNETVSEDSTNQTYENDVEKNQETTKVTPEEKIIELEDKVTRAFAEMENQRRRFEKERDDAFNYGGFAFAKETLNLIDNLEKSKHI